jgi:STE24 endopeptidase
MVMGLGRTRRIVVTDTMLHSFAPEETETVLAHELGHQRFLDPMKGIGVGAIVSLAMWSVAALAYASTYASFGFSSLGDMAGLPLLLLYSGIVSTALEPLELWWSRRREARADRFSLEVTRNPASFSAAMVKLHDQNLGIANPPRWEKWLFYSHPPGRERVETARAFDRAARSSV